MDNFNHLYYFNYTNNNINIYNWNNIDNNFNLIVNKIKIYPQMQQHWQPHRHL